MPFTRRHTTLAILGSAGVVVAALGYFGWQNGRVSAQPEALLKRLPAQDSVVAGLNFDRLRKSGMLQRLGEGKVQEEPDYTQFVRDTGFDYKRDLDYAMLSFSPDGTFLLVKGVFDWDKLESYTLRQKGNCYRHLCRIQGSRPERHISFFPLRHDLMAMAVAPDDTAATRLQQPGPQADINIPDQPAWLTISSGALRSATLPGSTQLFASAIADASRVTLTLGGGAGDLELRLDAICRDSERAGALTQQLRTLTNMLRAAAERQPPQHEAPQPQTSQTGDDLAGLLTSGTFDQAGSHVTGRWPVKKGLIETLAGGM